MSWFGEKYLKYKAKYMELKEQNSIGGEPNRCKAIRIKMGKVRNCHCKEFKSTGKSKICDNCNHDHKKEK